MLGAVRIVRAWNQTGQKFAGEPDIVKTYLYPHPGVLWFLVFTTYIWIHRELIFSYNGIIAPVSYAAVSGLALAAVTFKVAFTKEEAPELVFGFVNSVAELGFSRDHSLITRARAVFMALAAAFGCALFYIFTRKKLSFFGPGAYPYPQGS